MYFCCVHACVLNLTIHTYIKSILTLYFTILRIKNSWNSVASIISSCFQSQNVSLDASLRVCSDWASPSAPQPPAPSQAPRVSPLGRCQKWHSPPARLTFFVAFSGKCFFSVRQWQKRGFGCVVNFFSYSASGLIQKNVLFLTWPHSSCLSQEQMIYWDKHQIVFCIYILHFQSSYILLLYPSELFDWKLIFHGVIWYLKFLINGH